MSWFGDHISSLTGKISDFTKDVLNDASERVSIEGGFGSSTSKILFGSNDNEQKTPMAEKDDRVPSATISTEDNLATNSVDHSNNCDITVTDLENTVFLPNLNVLTMLNYIKNCNDNQEIFKDVLSKLQEFKNTVETNIHRDPDYAIKLSKIDNYINYFKVICDHSEETFPFMRETAFTFNEINSRVPPLHQSGPNGDSNGFYEMLEADEMHSIKDPGKFVSTDVQTDITSDQLPNRLHTQHKITSAIHDQAVDELESMCNNQLLLDHSASEIAKLKQQINFLKEEALLHSQKTELLPISTTYVQTDSEEDIPCHKCQDHEEVTESLQEENENLVEKICSLRNEIKGLKLSNESFLKSQNSISLQTYGLCQCPDSEVIISQQNKNIETLQVQLHEQEKLKSNLESKLSIISNLENDLNGMKKVITEKDELMNNQKDEIMILKQKISSLQKVVEGLTHKDGVQVETSVLNPNSTGNGSLEKSELSCHNDEKPNKIQDELAVLKQHLNSVNLEKKQLLCTLNEKSQECSNLKSEVREQSNKLQEQLVTLQQQLKSTNLEKEHLLFTLNEKSQECSDLKAEVLDLPNRIQEQLEVLQQQLKTVNLEKDQLLCTLNEKSQEYSDLKIQFHEQSNKIQEQLVVLQQQLKSVNLEKDQLLCTLNEKSQECSDLKAEVLDLPNKIQEQLVVLQQQLNTVNLEKDQLLCTLNEKSQECSDLKAEILDLPNKIQEQLVILQQQLKTVNLEKDQLLCALNEKSQECSDLKAEVLDLPNKMQEQLIVLQQQLKTMNLEKDQLLCTLNEKSQECSDLKAEVLDLPNKIQEQLLVLQQQLKTVNLERDQLLCTLNEKSQECSDLKAEVLDLPNKIQEQLVVLQQQLKTVNLERDQLLYTLNEKSQECNDLKAEVHEQPNEIQEQLVVLEHQLKSVNLEKDQLLCTLNEKSQECDDLKAEILELPNKIQKQLSVLQQQLKSVELEKDQLLCSLNEKSHERNDLKAEVHEQPNKIQEQLVVLQQQLKSVNVEKNQLLCMLNEKSQECSSLKTEVHRLTSIVASEKQALFKLQRDNKDLRQEQEGRFDSELTKEALQNLSRLVRDKDVEIEALKQKNDSLASVLQNSTPSHDHMQTLMTEHESLEKQIEKFKADREKIMKSYNAKDQKCRSQQAEIVKMNSELSAAMEKFDSLEQQHHAISLQYEEKQKTLINTQQEMIVLKQKVFDLEQELTTVKENYHGLLETVHSKSTVTVSRDEFTTNLNELVSLKATLHDKNDLIQEKDRLIHELSNDVKSLKLRLEQVQKEMLDREKSIDDLSGNLEIKKNSLAKAFEETTAAQQRLKAKASELNLLNDMNKELNMLLKEKEFTIKSLEEKISSLTVVVQEKTESINSVDVDQILSESKEMYNKAQRFYRERDEALLSLNQAKQENQELKTEIQKVKEKEDHLKNELDRLRKHLLQIEENYTNDALIAEDREKELRSQLAELETSTKLSSSAILDANHLANIQVSSLQEQVSMIAQQRDQALAQLSDLEDKVQLYSTSSTNLQLVLEKRQKEHDHKLKEMENKWLSELNKTKQRDAELQNLVDMKQKQLEESSQALEAASRLSEVLDSKEEVINSLKADLSKATNSLKTAMQELDSVRNNPDGKVDRIIMKSLVLGYFSTPPTQKSEVIRLLARVLDFNQEEMQKAGIVVSRNTGKVQQKGILSSLFGRLPSLSIHSSQTHEQGSTEPSFTTLFVKFLENESQPIIRMPLPAEQMAQEQTSKAHSHKRSSLTTGSPGRSPLLLNIDSAFPTFAALPAVDYNNSPAILKEVLE